MRLFEAAPQMGACNPPPLPQTDFRDLKLGSIGEAGTSVAAFIDSLRTTPLPTVEIPAAAIFLPTFEIRDAPPKEPGFSWQSLGLISAAEAQTVPPVEPAEPVEPVRSEESETRRSEESNSPEAITLRWAAYNYQIRELQRIDPKNRQLDTLHGPEWSPTGRDIQRLQDAISEVNDTAFERIYGTDDFGLPPLYEPWIHHVTPIPRELTDARRPASDPVAEPPRQSTRPCFAASLWATYAFYR